MRRVDSAAAFSGVYGNKPVYRSERAGFVGVPDFTSVVGVRCGKVDSFRIRALEGRGVSVELMLAGNIVHEKTFLFDEGLVLTSEGILELPRTTEAGWFDTPVIGVASRRFSLFLNGNGDLVLVNSGGGAGLIGIVPMGVYGRLMSVFPRIE